MATNQREDDWSGTDSNAELVDRSGSEESEDWFESYCLVTRSKICTESENQKRKMSQNQQQKE